MKLTTIIGVAIATVGLAACGSSVAPTVSPTLALTVSPTVAPTVASTLAPTVAPTPIATPAPTPSPTLNPCQTPEEAALVCDPVLTVTKCDGGNNNGVGGVVSWTDTNADDELLITYEPVINIEVNPTGTSGSYGGTIGELVQASYHYQFRNGNGDDISTDGASGSFTIVACALPTVTVTATCSQPDPAAGGTGVLKFSGVTVGDFLSVDAPSVAITSNPFTVSGMGVGTGTFSEYTNAYAVTPVATGTFSIAVCAVPHA